MKKNCLVTLLAIMLGFVAGPAMGQDASVEQGAKLFADPALGGSPNPAKCTDCHPGGQGLDQAGAKENLPAMINMCIQQALQGQQLNEQSVEMESLKLYIQSLAK